MVFVIYTWHLRVQRLTTPALCEMWHLSARVCVEGAGRSKKAAKRNAAAKMMAHIKGMSGGEGDQAPKVEESDEEEEIPLVGCTILVSFMNCMQQAITHRSY